jgi:hypothetical protein
MNVKLIKYYNYKFFFYLIMRNENMTMITVVSSTIDQNWFISFTIDGNDGNSTNWSNHKSMEGFVSSVLFIISTLLSRQILANHLM